MNILSLFDGISCGRIALDRANIKINKYYASEINKYAIKVSQNNYSDIIRLGDINNWHTWDIDWLSIDLILAGSPCQGFSFTGKQLAFNDSQSALFFQFAKILKHVKSLNPNIKFLLENVRMRKEFENIITFVVGVKPITMNSSLVSAQNRVRLYWVNWRFSYPKNKQRYLKDIIETELSQYHNIKYGTYDQITIKCKTPLSQTNVSDRMMKILTQSSSSSIKLDNKQNMGINVIGIANDTNNRTQYKRVYSTTGKSPTITTASGGGHCPKIAINHHDYRDMLAIEAERCQTLPDNYTQSISTTQRFNVIGNGWTVDIIAHILSGLNELNDT
ncbi:DNA (cytosine-5)-methyltransferase 3A [Orbus hercynius]|uniref:DNA (cytosine-5-)-methyltransferase n=1 Tax=Orbus hercynius TaxID=593135 RepID=A0A495RIY5_9GAMM|nr:DNA (cytosine-5-)-methyltransferase [Orbus hercynius]RKS87405.1 DNA (cytosine-5)-methyltransferase 3A [Orbus hercynius]